MSRFYGPTRQIGLVVRDVQKAMRYWTEVMGVGPFYVIPEQGFADFYYRGQPAAGPVITMAFAQSGDLQIELIQQHNDAPSAYREFLSAGREGLQHVSSWFDTRESYDRAHARMLELGLTVVHEVRNDHGAPRFAYFETGTPDAPLLELSEALLPETRFVPDTVAQAAAGWTGEDPVRHFQF